MNYFETTTGYIVNLDAVEYIERPDSKSRAGFLTMRGGERIPCRPEDIGELLQQVTIPNTDPTACVLMAEGEVLTVMRRVPVLCWRRGLNRWLPSTVLGEFFDGGYFALAQGGYITPLREGSAGEVIGYEEKYFASESAWLDWLKAEE